MYVQTIKYYDKWRQSLIYNVINLAYVCLHSYDTIFIAACNMEPCTWVDKSWIPTLQDIVWINKIGP